MLDKDAQIKKIIDDHKISYEGEVVRESGGDDVYLQVTISQLPDGSRVPTHKQLLKLKQSLLEIGVNLNVISSQVHREKFEELLRESLFLAFPDLLRNVFCTIESDEAYVWIESKSQLAEELTKKVEKSIDGFCKLQGIALRNVSKIGETKTPNKTAILATLRNFSPATTAELVNALTAKGFTIPSADWLARRLDSLRKTKSVISLADKKYVLSIAAISALGTSNKGAKSADITRMLAIWRRT